MVQKLIIPGATQDAAVDVASPIKSQDSRIRSCTPQSITPTKELATENEIKNLSKSARVLAERYKTRTCKTFMATGRCPYYQRCMFAHGLHEVRTLMMNVKDGLITQPAIKAYQAKKYGANQRPKSKTPQPTGAPEKTAPPARPARVVQEPVAEDDSAGQWVSVADGEAQDDSKAFMSVEDNFGDDGISSSQYQLASTDSLQLDFSFSHDDQRHVSVADRSSSVSPSRYSHSPYYAALSTSLQQ